jgi:hypothetical protein
VPGDRAVLAGPNWYTCLDLFYFNFHLLLLWCQENLLQSHVLVQLYAIC